MAYLSDEWYKFKYPEDREGRLDPEVNPIWTGVSVVVGFVIFFHVVPDLWKEYGPAVTAENTPAQASEKTPARASGNYEIGLDAYGRNDYTTALREWEPLAERGVARAQNKLGVMLQYGYGVPQDHKTAVKLYTLAAEQGDADAQNNLGMMHQYGNGVPQDNWIAIKWYGLAAEQGHTVASNYLKSLQQEITKQSHPPTVSGVKVVRHTSDLVVRQFPSNDAIAIAYLPRNEEFFIQHNTGTGWAYIKFSIGRHGYVPSKGLPQVARYPEIQIAEVKALEQAATEKKQLAELLRKVETTIALKKKRLAEQKNTQNALRKKHKFAFAVIIGNRDYKGRTPDVEYATNDADAVRQFVIDNLGYREGNIIDLRDVSLSEFNSTFGTAGNHKGRLFDYVRPNKSDVIVFYSGHGAPGQKNRKGYLLPVDADPNRVELNGYPLEVLLTNLAKIPARTMTVYLDACFSGQSEKGMLVRSTSGITIQAKLPKSARRMTVVTAAQEDQVASWDTDAEHGLFTKHLLEALTGKADGEDYGNQDGQVTLAELRTYLDEEMTYQARSRWGRDQNASVQGKLDSVLATVR